MRENAAPPSFPSLCWALAHGGGKDLAGASKPAADGERGMPGSAGKLQPGHPQAAHQPRWAPGQGFCSQDDGQGRGGGRARGRLVKESWLAARVPGPLWGSPTPPAHFQGLMCTSKPDSQGNRDAERVLWGRRGLPETQTLNEPSEGALSNVFQADFTLIRCLGSDSEAGIQSERVRIPQDSGRKGACLGHRFGGS